MFSEGGKKAKRKEWKEGEKRRRLSGVERWGRKEKKVIREEGREDGGEKREDGFVVKLWKDG